MATRKNKKPLPSARSWNKNVTLPNSESRKRLFAITVAAIALYVILVEIIGRASLPGGAVFLSYLPWVQNIIAPFELAILLVLWIILAVRPESLDTIIGANSPKITRAKSHVKVAEIFWRALLAEFLAALVTAPIVFIVGFSSYGDDCTYASYAPCNPVTAFGPWVAKIVFSFCAVLFGYLLIRAARHKQDKRIVWFAGFVLLLLSTWLMNAFYLLVGNVFKSGFQAGGLSFLESLLLICLYPLFAIAECVWSLQPPAKKRATKRSRKKVT